MLLQNLLPEALPSSNPSVAIGRFPYFLFSGEQDAITYDTMQFCGDEVIDEFQFYKIIQDDSILSQHGKTVKPTWDSNTILLMSFENNLDAGNFPANNNPVTHWRILRRLPTDTEYTLIDTIPNVGTNTYYDTYSEAGVDYIYAVQAVSNGKIGEAVPAEVAQVGFWGWKLTSTSYNEETNTGTAYSFTIGNEADSIPMNRARTIYELNFSQFPKIEYGTSKYRSGSLSTIPYTCLTGDYDLARNITREELEAFMLDRQPKILKNGSGLTMVVDISEYSFQYMNEITTPNTNEQPFTLSFSYVEIADINQI